MKRLPRVIGTPRGRVVPGSKRFSGSSWVFTRPASWRESSDEQLTRKRLLVCKQYTTGRRAPTDRLSATRRRYGSAAALPHPEGVHRAPRRLILGARTVVPGDGRARTVIDTAAEDFPNDESSRNCLEYFRGSSPLQPRTCVL